MKKTFKRIILLGLSAVMLTSVLPGTITASAAAVDTGNSSSSEYEGLASGCEEIDFSTLSDDEIISSVEDYMEFSGNSASLVGSAASALPKECDNSTNETAYIVLRSATRALSLDALAGLQLIITTPIRLTVPTVSLQPKTTSIHQFGHTTSATPVLFKADRIHRETTISFAQWARLLWRMFR